MTNTTKENTNKRRCIRSLRVARALMAAGFPAVDSEPSRHKPGLLVWIFDNTDEFDVAFNRIVGIIVS